jgi:hypothetical protein
MYAALKGAAAITAVVGTDIYPDQADQSAARPYLVFQEVSNAKPKTMRGTIDIRNARFQLTAWADEREDLAELLVAIEGLLDGKAATIGGLTVKYSRIEPGEGAVDEDEPADEGYGDGPRVLRVDVLWTY